MILRGSSSGVIGPAYALLAGSASFGKRVDVDIQRVAADSVFVVFGAFRDNYFWLAGVDVSGAFTGTPSSAFVARSFDGEVRLYARDTLLEEGAPASLRVDVAVSGNLAEVRLSVDGGPSLLYSTTTQILLNGRVGLGVAGGVCDFGLIAVEELP